MYKSTFSTLSLWGSTTRECMKLLNSCSYGVQRSYEEIPFEEYEMLNEDVTANKAALYD